MTVAENAKVLSELVDSVSRLREGMTREITQQSERTDDLLRRVSELERQADGRGKKWWER